VQFLHRVPKFRRAMRNLIGDFVNGRSLNCENET
jgi:hypothetical protein